MKKRALPVYLAVLLTVLMTGLIFGFYSPFSLTNTQNCNQSSFGEEFPIADPEVKRGIDVLAASAGVEGPLEWVGFRGGDGSPETLKQMVVVDGRGPDDRQRVRVIFDSTMREIISLTVSRAGMDPAQPLPQGSNLHGETSRYLANLGEIMGDKWTWTGRGKSVGGSYRTYWRSTRRTAYVTLDEQTGNLLYFRLYPPRDGQLVFRPRPRQAEPGETR